MRNTRLIVDLSKYNSNIEKIKKYVGKKILIPIVKANAYGTYINKRIDVLNQFKILGVALVEEAVLLINKHNFNPKYIHIEASSGILKNKKLDFVNAVRPGIITYRYEPFSESNDILNVDPICKLISSIDFIKDVKKGEAVSYGQKFICDSDMTIATIPIGYADGYRRKFTNKGYVYINNHKAKVVGSVCMDSIMVDVTGIDANVGDEVVIFDNQNITLDELASMCSTINYEILSNISYRVPRMFIEN